jgi:uncharacterized protein with von Willebrand factor type A (vWA) domain
VTTPEEHAVAFAGHLRAAGVPVPVGATVTYVRALAELDGTPDDVYWAGRAALVSSPDQIDAYDRTFDWYFRGAPRPEQATIVDAVGPPRGEGEAGDHTTSVTSEATEVRGEASAIEVLRTKDFAHYDADELDEARRLMADMRLVAPPRRSRRRRSSSRERGPLDLRRTIRASIANGGEVLRWRTLERRTRPRRIVLLLDVSGSMEPYSRALLRFAHASVVGGADVEVFTLGTRLTRLTRELSTHDPDVALDRASQVVPDWSGGTRLGDGLRLFNDRFGVRGMARGAVVVVLSDGWDRGDPDQLATEMARLSRVADRVVWVNPLKATEGYEPLTRGMAAALPYVDDFIAGHSLDALDELAAALASVVGRDSRGAHPATQAVPSTPAPQRNHEEGPG